MAGDIKAKYGTAVALTQTNLDGIASSATWVAGWTSGSINNTSDLALDYLVAATLQVESAGLAAGEIRISAYSCLSPTTPTWPDLFSAGTEGTEGTATINDTEIRDCAFQPLKTIVTDTTASRNYPTPMMSILQAFGGVAVPPYFAIFIAQSTGAALETTGDPNQVYVTPVLAQYT